MGGGMMIEMHNIYPCEKTTVPAFYTALHNSGTGGTGNHVVAWFKQNLHK